MSTLELGSGAMEEKDSLSRNTARLSIAGADGAQARQLLHSLEEESVGNRRDSAVSFGSSSDENDNSADTKHNGSTPDHQQKPGKRRRSSTISVSLPKTKVHKTKVHKRKMKRSSKEPAIGFEQDANSPDDSKPDSNSVSMLAFRTILTSIFSDLPPSEKSNLKITGTDNIQKVVICFVGGLTRDDVVDDSNPQSVSVPIKEDAKMKFPFLAKTFETGLLTKGPGDKKNVFPPMDAIINMRLSKNERKQLIHQLKINKITIHDLLMPLTTMVNQNYPIHSDLVESELPEGWVETKAFEHDGSHIFSVDCEFCLTEFGKELTRISIVNFKGDVVYDAYVKPQNPIIDYLTKYSGITEKLLDGVETTLKDVQQKFLQLASRDDILIGHSLESDLTKLKIRHPNIVDTSICYQHVRGLPYKPGLKWLTKRYLNRDIQMGEQTGDGHSSVEDARACLDLVKMKISEGILFGVNDLTASVFDKLNDSRRRLGKEVIKSLILEHRYCTSQTETTKSFDVCSDDEVVDIFTKEIDDTDIAILNFRELEASLGWNSTCKVQTDVEQSYAKLNERLEAVYASLPQNSVFIVSGIYGANLNNHLSLKRIRTEYEARKKRGDALEELTADETWDFEKITALDEAMVKARDNISFVTIKT